MRPRTETHPSPRSTNLDTPVSPDVLTRLTALLSNAWIVRVRLLLDATPTFDVNGLTQDLAPPTITPRCSASQSETIHPLGLVALREYDGELGLEDCQRGGYHCFRSTEPRQAGIARCKRGPKTYLRRQTQYPDSNHHPDHPPLLPRPRLQTSPLPPKPHDARIRTMVDIRKRPRVITHSAQTTAFQRVLDPANCEGVL